MLVAWVQCLTWRKVLKVKREQHTGAQKPHFLPSGSPLTLRGLSASSCRYTAGPFDVEAAWCPPLGEVNSPATRAKRNHYAAFNGVAIERRNVTKLRITSKGKNQCNYT